MKYDYLVKRLKELVYEIADAMAADGDVKQLCRLENTLEYLKTYVYSVNGTIGDMGATKMSFEVLAAELDRVNCERRELASKLDRAEDALIDFRDKIRSLGLFDEKCKEQTK